MSAKSPQFHGPSLARQTPVRARASSPDANVCKTASKIMDLRLARKARPRPSPRDPRLWGGSNRRRPGRAFFCGRSATIGPFRTLAIAQIRPHLLSETLNFERLRLRRSPRRQISAAWKPNGRFRVHGGIVRDRGRILRRLNVSIEPETDACRHLRLVDPLCRRRRRRAAAVRARQGHRRPVPRSGRLRPLSRRPPRPLTLASSAKGHRLNRRPSLRLRFRSAYECARTYPRPDDDMRARR